uniref:Uncharacterized protein n=1 Tax=Anguilla anguilla TaxID=7936 RepID=A0A0E9W590_ANGAN
MLAYIRMLIHMHLRKQKCNNIHTNGCSHTYIHTTTPIHAHT